MIYIINPVRIQDSGNFQIYSQFIKGMIMSNTQSQKHITIQDDNFRHQAFNRNKEKFNKLHNQLMAYNSIMQNEMIFTLEQVNEMEDYTLQALDDMKEYILQQRRELNFKFIEVDNVDEYQKKIDAKYGYY